MVCSALYNTLISYLLYLLICGAEPHRIGLPAEMQVPEETSIVSHLFLAARDTADQRINVPDPQCLQPSHGLHRRASDRLGWGTLKHPLSVTGTFGQASHVLGFSLLRRISDVRIAGHTVVVLEHFVRILSRQL